MKRIALALALTTGAAVGVAFAADEPKAVTFAKADLGKVPAGWTAARTGKGEGSVWKVVEDRAAPSGSGYALAQTAEGPTASTKPSLIATQPPASSRRPSSIVTTSSASCTSRSATGRR